MESVSIEQKIELAKQNVESAQSILEQQRKIAGVHEAAAWLEKCQKEWKALDQQKNLMLAEARDKKALHQFRVAFEHHGSEWQHRRDWNLKQVGELIGVEKYPVNKTLTRMLNEEFGDIFTFELLDSPYTGGTYLFVAPRLMLTRK